jgi:hypothetical protein
MSEITRRALLSAIAVLVGTVAGQIAGILVATDGGSIAQCFMAGGAAFATTTALVLGFCHALKAL